MANPFTSLRPVQKITDADAVLAVTRLLEEHAASREAATLALNVDAEVSCFLCRQSVRLSEAVFGIGDDDQTREKFPMHRACMDADTYAERFIAQVDRGDARPVHGYVEAQPPLTPEDIKRLRKIADWVNGPHRKVVGPIVSKYFPFLVQKEEQPS